MVVISGGRREEAEAGPVLSGESHGGRMRVEGNAGSVWEGGREGGWEGGSQGHSTCSLNFSLNFIYLFIYLFIHSFIYLFIY